MKNEFKIFLLKLVKFVIIFIAIDYGFGSIAEALFFLQTKGKYARITYAIEKVSDDILIFGSSHANRHFVPGVFERELYLSCYNTGVQGQKILFLSAFKEMVLTRTTPKMIILNVDNDWLCCSTESYDRLADLHPYYSRYPDIIKSRICLKSKYDFLKLHLKSYQFNSTIVHIIKYAFDSQKDYKGYRPLFGKMSSENNKQVRINEVENIPIDRNFESALINFILLSKRKRINLIFTLSPSVYGIDRSNYESIQKILLFAEKYKIPVYDFTYDLHFINQNHLFHDPSHLNHEGALLFSELLAKRIKEDDKEIIVSYTNKETVNKE